MAGDPRVFGSHWIEDDEPYVRVLQCFVCKTMEELPDYHGNPDHDVILSELLVEHGSLSENPHVGALHHVTLRQWTDTSVKRAVVEGMWAHEKGFKPSYYDVKNTLVEDAGRCFNAHHRSVPCLDWESDSKRLASPAAKDRALLARELRDDSIKHVDIKVYLCHFCPVKAKVDQAKFDDAVRKGLA